MVAVGCVSVGVCEALELGGESENEQWGHCVPDLTYKMGLQAGMEDNRQDKLKICFPVWTTKNFSFKNNQLLKL